MDIKSEKCYLNLKIAYIRERRTLRKNTAIPAALTYAASASDLTLTFRENTIMAIKYRLELDTDPCNPRTEYDGASEDEYLRYLEGDVWGFEIYDDENGHVIDSCWGFYGREYCEQRAQEMLTYWKDHAND